MESTSRLPLPRRRLALFLLVLVVPFVVLVALAVRTLEQERELAVRRGDDERRQLAAVVRQELLGRLENLALRALSGASGAERDGPALDVDARDAIVLVAQVSDGRLVLPWENRAAAADVRRLLGEQPFAGLIASGEGEELIQQQPGRAAAVYQRAVSSARHPVQEASAELLVARALGKAGRPAEALVATRRLLSRPLSLADELGVPFALYAARRVADLEGPSPEDAGAALEAARRTAALPGVPPLAVRMAAAVVTTLRTKGPPGIQADAAAVEDAVAVRIARGEQALQLQQTFPALVRQFPPPSAPDRDPYWVPFGSGPWLLSLSSDIRSGVPTLIAVDAVQVFDRLESVVPCAAAGGCRLALASDAGADDHPLGAALPGLALLDVTTAAAGESRTWIRGQGFYVAALSLVVALAAFGGYLLWRDVRRELHVAAMRSQFVSSVSHELKTPLTAIRMFAETLRMGRPADPARRDEYLDTIVNESERLTRLLNNVLDFTRIESGRKIYQFASLDLESIVRTATRAMHYPLARQGFELRAEIDAGIAPVHGDADALEQAILNLLANALRYSGESRTIELRLTRDGTDAVISVRDWGIGIAPIDQRRIFDKFYRVERPETLLIPGTGLGLTLVDHIVRSHHGRVEVDSTPGGGSTFRLHLPLAPDEAEEAGLETASQPAAGLEA